MIWTKTSPDTWKLDDKWSVMRIPDLSGLPEYKVLYNGVVVSNSYFPYLKRAKAEVERLRRMLTKRDRMLEVCKHLISSGLAFGYKKDLKEPEYTAERGLADIEKIMRED